MKPLPPDTKRLARKGSSSLPKTSAAARQVDELPTRAPGGQHARSWTLYGRSGTGKTTLFGSFPGRKLLLDVKDVGDDSLDGVPDLDVMDVRTWDDFEMAYWYVVKHPDKYQSLGIDTMSQLQQLAILKVLEMKGKDPERAGDWGVMTKKEWGDVASLMKAWIINLRDLPMEVVFIAQDRVFNVSEEDEANGLDPEVGPGLSPSIAKCLNAAVHFVGNTFIRRRDVEVKIKDPPKGSPKTKQVEKIEFCIRVGPNPIYITKVRKAKSITLPSLVVDPTYDRLISMITGEDVK